MTGKGGLALVLLGVMGAAWWWTLSQPVVRALPAGTTASGRPAPSPIAAPAVALDRLQRLAPPSVEASGRDPFGGTSSAPGSEIWRDAVRTAALGLQEAAPVAPEPRWPRLVLIGIARQGTPASPTPVAILSGERGVVHARAGEVVAEVYRVETVGDDRVDLTLMPEARTVTLRLR